MIWTQYCSLTSCPPYHVWSSSVSPPHIMINVTMMWCGSCTPSLLASCSAQALYTVVTVCIYPSVRLSVFPSCIHFSTTLKNYWSTETCFASRTRNFRLKAFVKLLTNGMICSYRWLLSAIQTSSAAKNKFPTTGYSQPCTVSGQFIYDIFVKFEMN